MSEIRIDAPSAFSPIIVIVPFPDGERSYRVRDKITLADLRARKTPAVDGYDDSFDNSADDDDDLATEAPDLIRILVRSDGEPVPDDEFDDLDFRILTLISTRVIETLTEQATGKRGNPSRTGRLKRV